MHSPLSFLGCELARFGHEGAQRCRFMGKLPFQTFNPGSVVSVKPLCILDEFFKRSSSRLVTPRFREDCSSSESDVRRAASRVPYKFTRRR